MQADLSLHSLFVKYTQLQKKPGPFQFDPLPDNKSLALSNLKAFSHNGFIVAWMAQFLSNRVENIVQKGENAGFPQHFQNLFSSSPVVKICHFRGKE